MRAQHERRPLAGRAADEVADRVPPHGQPRVLHPSRDAVGSSCQRGCSEAADEPIGFLADGAELVGAREHVGCRSGHDAGR